VVTRPSCSRTRPVGCMWPVRADAGASLWSDPQARKPRFRSCSRCPAACRDGLDWLRSDLVGDCGHGLYAAVDHEADVEMVLVAGHGELEPISEVERLAEVGASAQGTLTFRSPRIVRSRMIKGIRCELLLSPRRSFARKECLVAFFEARHS
jgi:hypothetical protein